jgi:2-polyprenyl-6-methoxyphenol hydroxylase-like FAD-dependent oxidoreductase
MRIVCVGGGPAGLYFSILMKLWDPANDVIVFERYKEGVTHGWGVTMERRFLATLTEFDAETATEIAARSVRWQEQVSCIHGGREVNRDNSEACGVSRQKFVDILAARASELGVDIRYESDVTGTAELPDADLIVAADGANSQLRGACAEFGTRVAEGRNKYIWLGTGAAWDAFNFFFVPTEAGWLSGYAYPHEPMTSTLIVECAASTWAALGFDQVSPSRTCDILEELFEDHLEGRRLWTQFSDGLDARWLNFRTVSNERWHHGNVVLVGDSAHTAHFSVGLGTTLALQDVIALAGQLRRAGNLADGGLGAALTAYQEQRQAELRSHVTAAERSALWFENLPRYAGLSPRQFATVLHSRRAAHLSKLPPRLFCLLQDLKQRPGTVRRGKQAARLPEGRPLAQDQKRAPQQQAGEPPQRAGGRPEPGAVSAQRALGAAPVVVMRAPRMTAPADHADCLVRVHRTGMLAASHAMPERDHAARPRTHRGCAGSPRTPRTGARARDPRAPSSPGVPGRRAGRQSPRRAHPDLAAARAAR